MEDPSTPFAAEMLQLDYFYCCDEVGGELLVQASQALSEKVGEFPAPLQARALWRFLRLEATCALQVVDTEVLELLEALDELACATAVVPRAGGALRLEVRAAQGCRRPPGARAASS